MSQVVWFCGSQEGNKGPFNRQQMDDLLQRGVITGETYIWREGFANWTKLSECGDFDADALHTPRRTSTPREGQPARAQPSGAQQAAARIPDAQNQDDYLDGVFVDLVKASWKRFHKKKTSGEVDEVLVGAVITATLDNGYVLIDLESTGTDHYLRFEQLEDGTRIIFKLTHHAESILTSSVLGHEASVRIGYGERVKNFGAVWKAIKQEMKGGYIHQVEPGIITVDGDISSQYIYVEVGMLWDINDYLDPDNPYKVKYPKLTEDVGASIHALRKYLRGRLSG